MIACLQFLRVVTGDANIIRIYFTSDALSEKAMNADFKPAANINNELTNVKCHGIGIHF
jgi:hypothetical protein